MKQENKKKRDWVLIISFVLGMISCCFVRPDKEYLAYFDGKVLCILLGLMLVVAGIRETGVFLYLEQRLTDTMKTTRKMSLALIGVCFFLSMVITNDVALLTFVPFTLAMCREWDKKDVMTLVVLETIAANLGSVLTPIGNPQNLYLYHVSGVSLDTFLIWMCPVAGVGLFLLVFFGLKFPNQVIAGKGEKASIQLPQLAGYLILFVLCLLTVIRILDYRWMIFLVGGIIFIWNRKLWKQVDYHLLLTFMAFFLFVGNLQRIPQIRLLLEHIMKGREAVVGVVSSQFLSNVPAAMMLSGFTGNYHQLLLGVNIGGLGTLVASMASLISYRLFADAYPREKGQYLKNFSIYNLIFLLVLCLLLLR